MARGPREIQFGSDFKGRLAPRERSAPAGFKAVRREAVGCNLVATTDRASRELEGSAGRVSEVAQQVTGLMTNSKTEQAGPHNDYRACIEASQRGACRERDLRKIRELMNHDPALAEELARMLEEPAGAELKRKK